MRVRRTGRAALALAGALALPALLAACDGSGFDPQADDSASVSAEPTAPETSASASSTPPTPSESATTGDTGSASRSPAPAKPIPHACDLVESAEVGEAFAARFDAGKPSADEKTCTFKAEGYVTAQVVARDASACTPPPEDGTIVEPLSEVAGATRAWWVVSDAPPLRSELRACTATAMLGIHLSYVRDYDNDPRNDSISLAEKLLQELR